MALPDTLSPAACPCGSARRYADWIEAHPRPTSVRIEEPTGPEVRWRLERGD